MISVLSIELFVSIINKNYGHIRIQSNNEEIVYPNPLILTNEMLDALPFDVIFIILDEHLDNFECLMLQRVCRALRALSEEIVCYVSRSRDRPKK